MSICYVMMIVFMTGMFCIVSFFVGILSTSSKNKINLNPVEAYKEHKELKQQKEINNLEQRQNAIMMDNINKYDGTSRGQSDIPNQ